MENIKRIFEINANHQIFINLNKIYEKDPKNPQLEEWVRLLYDQAIIAEGRLVKDSAAYLKRVNELLMNVSATTAGENSDK